MKSPQIIAVLAGLLVMWVPSCASGPAINDGRIAESCNPTARTISKRILGIIQHIKDPKRNVLGGELEIQLLEALTNLLPRIDLQIAFSENLFFVATKTEGVFRKERVPYENNPKGNIWIVEQSGDKALLIVSSTGPKQTSIVEIEGTAVRVIYDPQVKPTIDYGPDYVGFINNRPEAVIAMAPGRGLHNNPGGIALLLGETTTPSISQASIEPRLFVIYQDVSRHYQLEIVPTRSQDWVEHSATTTEKQNVVEPSSVRKVKRDTIREFELKPGQALTVDGVGIVSFDGLNEREIILWRAFRWPLPIDDREEHSVGNRNYLTILSVSENLPLLKVRVRTRHRPWYDWSF